MFYYRQSHQSFQQSNWILNHPDIQRKQVLRVKFCYIRSKYKTVKVNKQRVLWHNLFITGNYVWPTTLNSII